MKKYKNMNFSSDMRKRIDETIEILEQDLSRIRTLVMANESVHKINQEISYARHRSDTLLDMVSLVNTSRIIEKTEEES